MSLQCARMDLYRGWCCCSPCLGSRVRQGWWIGCGYDNKYTVLLTRLFPRLLCECRDTWVTHALSLSQSQSMSQRNGHSECQQPAGGGWRRFEDRQQGSRSSTKSVGLLLLVSHPSISVQNIFILEKKTHRKQLNIYSLFILLLKTQVFLAVIDLFFAAFLFKMGRST